MDQGSERPGRRKDRADHGIELNDRGEGAFCTRGIFVRILVFHKDFTLHFPSNGGKGSRVKSSSVTKI